MDPKNILRVAKALGIPYAGLVEAVQAILKDVSQSRRQREVAQFLETSFAMSRDGSVRRIIDACYNDEALSAVGLGKYSLTIHDVPVVTTLATKPEWTKTPVTLDGQRDSCQLLDTMPPTEMLSPRQIAESLVFLEDRGIKVWDNPVFRLTEIDIGDGCFNAKFCLDSYFRYRFSSGSMQDELVRAVMETKETPELIGKRFDRYLPMRSKYMPDAESVATCPRRICAGGVNVLVALARPESNDFGLVLQRRSNTVASRQGALATIPAGHHQPTVSPSEEVPISHTVRRELFEELFGGEEAQRGSRRLVHDWYKSECPPIYWLDRHKGSYDVSLTGFGYSLITGSYSFSVLLAVLDESFWVEYSQMMKTNWEVTSLQDPIVSSTSGRLGELMQENGWTDWGLFTFAQGLRRLQVLEPRRVKMPRMEYDMR